MHYVGHVDWSFAASPIPATATSSGLSRLRVVGPDQGAIHTDLAVGALAPSGWIAPHVHAYEEALYVLEGELLLDLGGRVHRLVTGDYALIPTALRHALGNTSAAPIRFLSLNSPRRVEPDSGRRDTFFESAQDLKAMSAAAQRPPFGDPTLRLVGHYDGTPPQLETLRIKDEARGRAPAGMDTALLAYSGISVKMLVDRGFGADHVTMFTVDYELGGAAQAHDHPFEEAYFFLAGEIEAELDGKHYTLRAGDIVFASVGSVHGFYNVGTERVRWIETQAPQPPARHSYRWVRSWERYEQEHTTTGGRS
ncbi:MAG: cupin domain-containing protein [Chloroflexota bacterium]